MYDNARVWALQTAVAAIATISSSFIGPTAAFLCCVTGFSLAWFVRVLRDMAGRRASDGEGV